MRVTHQEASKNKYGRSTIDQRREDLQVSVFESFATLFKYSGGI